MKKHDAPAPTLGRQMSLMFEPRTLDGMDGAAPQITQALPMQPGWCYNEPLHVPSVSHEGWLITFVDHQTGENTFEHFAWVLEAGAIAKGPVASIRIPGLCATSMSVPTLWPAISTSAQRGPKVPVLGTGRYSTVSALKPSRVSSCSTSRVARSMPADRRSAAAAVCSTIEAFCCVV